MACNTHEEHWVVRDRRNHRDCSLAQHVSNSEWEAKTMLYFLYVNPRRVARKRKMDKFYAKTKSEV